MTVYVLRCTTGGQTRYVSRTRNEIERVLAFNHRQDAREALAIVARNGKHSGHDIHVVHTSETRLANELRDASIDMCALRADDFAVERSVILRRSHRRRRQRSQDSARFDAERLERDFQLDVVEKLE